jgi:hypothetical protein
MNDQKQYWFPAKRYGWGWGLPCSWQGWLVLLAALFVIGWAAVVLRPHDPVRFTLVSVGTVAALILVCLAKGEPPSWRWGNDR